MIPTITKEVAKLLSLEVPATIENYQGLTSHPGVACDGCGLKGIVGIRYKCAVCSNFDFCEDCEARKDHPHCFIKIRKPEHITAQGMNPHCRMVKAIKKMFKGCLAELQEEGDDPVELLIARLGEMGINAADLRTKPLIRGKTLPELAKKFLRKD